MQCGTFIIIASSCAGRQAVCLLTSFTRKTRCCRRSSAGTSGAPRGPWRGFPWRWHTRSWQATPPRSSGAFLDMQRPCSRPGCPHLCHAHDTECFDRRLPFSTPARKKKSRLADAAAPSVPVGGLSPVSSWWVQEAEGPRRAQRSLQDRWRPPAQLRRAGPHAD